jgi:ABC-type transport system involved in multi-copper enzyme maturation permease subunit
MWQIVLKVELEKLFRRQLLIVLLALVAGITCLIFLGGYGIAQDLQLDSRDTQEFTKAMFQALGWPGGLEMSLRAASSMGNIAIMIAMAAVVGSEYSWRTVHLWVSQGIDRTIMLLTRSATLLIPAALLVALPLLVGVVMMVTLNFPNEARTVVGKLDQGQLFLNIGYVFMVILMHAALALFAAVLTRSVAGAIALSLVYKFTLEGIITTFGLFDQQANSLAKFLPMRAADALTVAPIDQVVSNPVDGLPPATELLNSFYLDPTPAAICVIIYTILLVSGSVLIFRNQDLTS